MDSNRVRVIELAEHLWVVELADEHDLSTADHVEAALSLVPRSGSTLVLDLSGATFIDSTVLAAILQAQDAADLNGRGGFVVVAPQGSQPRRLLDLVAVGDRVQICDSRPGAIEGLSPMIPQA